jgi:hypothetical protein
MNPAAGMGWPSSPESEAACLLQPKLLETFKPFLMHKQAFPALRVSLYVEEGGQSPLGPPRFPAALPRLAPTRRLLCWLHFLFGFCFSPCNWHQ